MISSGPLKITALATAGLLGAGALAVVQGEIRPGSAAAATHARPVPPPRPHGPLVPPGMEPPGMPHAEIGPPPGFRMQIDPERFEQRRDEFHGALAEKLGVSPERVESAFREVFQDRVDEAVQRGALTRGQADDMLEAWESGTPPRPPHGMVPRRPMGGPPAPLPPPLP